MNELKLDLILNGSPYTLDFVADLKYSELDLVNALRLDPLLTYKYHAILAEFNRELLTNQAKYDMISATVKCGNTPAHPEQLKELADRVASYKEGVKKLKLALLRLEERRQRIRQKATQIRNHIRSQISF